MSVRLQYSLDRFTEQSPTPAWKSLKYRIEVPNLTGIGLPPSEIMDIVPSMLQVTEVPDMVVGLSIPNAILPSTRKWEPSTAEQPLRSTFVYDPSMGFSWDSDV